MKKRSQVSVIVTVLEEKESVVALLKSLTNQTLRPSEIIIADGGSSDGTQEIITKFAHKKKSIPIVLLNTFGNRSVGRNAAIEASHNELIAITDAGCIPQKNWLEELLYDQQKSNASVIAGGAFAIQGTKFEAAAAPFFLVMPDKLSPETFLPATRSMLIAKSAWKKVGKFDESLSHNEDYAFAKKLQKMNIAIQYVGNAKVAWMPPKSLKSFGNTIYRFAVGDIEAGIVRPKVFFLFARYLIGVALVVLLLQFSFFNAVVFTVVALILYGVWAIKKRIYAPQAWLWFPILQLVADYNVLRGSIIGMLSFGHRQLQK